MIETAKMREHRISGVISLVIILALCAAFGAWIFNWYSDATVHASWLIHVLIWMFAFSLLKDIGNCVMIIAGYKKIWTRNWQEEESK